MGTLLVNTKNKIVNTRVYGVMLPDVAIQKYSENFIWENLYRQVEKKGHRYKFMDEIVYHCKDKTMVTNNEGYAEG